LELLARALRSGQSLAAGLQVIGQEMLEPIGVEFGKAYERQKLGMPVEETLKEIKKQNFALLAESYILRLMILSQLIN
jgi:tight adherence protein B